MAGLPLFDFSEVDIAEGAMSMARVRPFWCGDLLLARWSGTVGTLLLFLWATAVMSMVGPVLAADSDSVTASATGDDLANISPDPAFMASGAAKHDVRVYYGIATHEQYGSGEPVRSLLKFSVPPVPAGDGRSWKVGSATLTLTRTAKSFNDPPIEICYVPDNGWHGVLAHVPDAQRVTWETQPEAVTPVLVRQTIDSSDAADARETFDVSGLFAAPHEVKPGEQVSLLIRTAEGGGGKGVRFDGVLGAGGTGDAAAQLTITFVPEEGNMPAPSDGAKATEEEGFTAWVSGNALLPQWGFFRRRGALGGTESLDRQAAWNPSGDTSHRLTWVVDVPDPGAYHIWTRVYGGYGKIQVTVNERPLTETAKSEPGANARYIWVRQGTVELDRSGPSHVDVHLTKSIFDALLITDDEAYEPWADALPPADEAPIVVSHRTYRDDAPLHSQAEGHPLVAAPVEREAKLIYDWLPDADEVGAPLRLWGGAGQFVAGSFAVRALNEVDELRVELSRLDGPNGTSITSDDVDLRVVQIRPRWYRVMADKPELAHLGPDLLLRDDRQVTSTGRPLGAQGGFGGGCVTTIRAHESRQFWVTVRLAGEVPAGQYVGAVMLRYGEGPTQHVELPVEVEVLDVGLERVDGYYSLYHRGLTSDPEHKFHISVEQMRANMADLARHGMTAAILHDFSDVQYAVEAGLMRSPAILRWPPSQAEEQLAEAKAMGLPSVLWYGVDEPRTEAEMTRARDEALRRKERGVSIFMAMNVPEAWDALHDVVDRPVYNLMRFDGEDNERVLKVRELGYTPISYWAVSGAPIQERAFIGLYNRRCGFVGSAPWAYQDAPDPELYDEALGERWIHAVAYPDEHGQPIPTVVWESLRDGIDDVRYLQALDRALGEASERPTSADLDAAIEAARQTRGDCYESIRGRWFSYLSSLKPGDLDETRRQLAEATAALRKVMKP